MSETNAGKLTSMHFYAWKKGLKTGMYYLRSTAAADAIKFTLDKEGVKEVAGVEDEVTELVGVDETVMAQTVVAENQQTIPYSADYEQNRADMACSLDNPDACEACGS